MDAQICDAVHTVRRQWRPIRGWMTAPLSTNRRRPERQDILAAATSLGVLGGGPQSTAKVLAMMCNSEITSREVQKVFEGQPALAARVLRVANSPYYGQARTVTTVSRAITLLGLNAVRGIAAAACMERAVGSVGKVGLVDTDALLMHSLATAVSAEVLAAMRHPELVSEAFIAGLLHNLGVAVQLRVDASGIESMLQALTLDASRGIRSLEADHAALFHEECVAVIFEAWQLPSLLIEAVRHHHDPTNAPPMHRDLASLINVGSHLARLCGHSFSLEPAGNDSLAPVETWGLSPEDLAQVMPAIQTRIQQIR